MSDALSAMRLPWRLRLWLFAISSCSTLCLRSNGTVNRTLTKLFDARSPPLKKPLNGLKSLDITVDTSRNLWFRLYLPTSEAVSASLPLIVYFHGGGFIFLSPDSKIPNELCQRLAREIPAVIISVNYRLSPEHRYPSAYEDACDVLKFIDRSEIAEIPANVDLNRCFLAGDSAGGNIAHHAALRCGEYGFRELKIMGIIGIQPFFGGEERTQSETELSGDPLVSVTWTDLFWKAFLPEGADRDHPAANVFGRKAEDISEKKVPASIVFVGGFDPLKDWQKRYCEGLKKSGKEARLIEYPNAFHLFYGFPELPEWPMFVKEIAHFIQTQSSTPS